MPTSVAKAYQHCKQIAKNHYENFPVASWLLPNKLREPVTAIYAFARTADDFADEGNISPKQRIELLNNYRQCLDNLSSTTDSLIFIALKDTIDKHNLPLEPFYVLLDAFSQDVTKNRYNNQNEVLDYCKKSANPIGYLLLTLTNNLNSENIYKSNAICTMLQLINFVQDVEFDLINSDRCYLPMDTMEQYQLTTSDLLAKQKTDKYHQAIKQQLKLIKQLYNVGYDLGHQIPGIFGFELRLIIACAKHLILSLEKRNNPYIRPVIRKYNFLGLLWQATTNKSLRMA